MFDRDMTSSADERGFTMIELLVVVIIIGILAAIAIPVFLNQRRRAVDASLKSDLRVVASELESYFATNQAYPTANAADSSSVFPAVELSPGNSVVVTTDNSSENYCLVATGSGRGTRPFVFDKNVGGMQPASVTTC